MKFPLSILSVLVTLVVFLTAPAHAVLLEFTTGEGYANGSLSGQPSASNTWLQSGAGSPFTVNTSAGGSVSYDVAQNSRVVGYAESLNFQTGNPFTVSIDLQFVQSTATVGGSTVFANLTFLTGQNTGTIAGTTLGLGRTSTLDGYRIAAFSSISTNIAGSALGINSAGLDTTSDLLRLTYTLTQGATNTTWLASYTLRNVTTATDVVTNSVSNINIGSGAGDTSLFSALASGASMTTSGLSSFQVNSYSLVPEPTAVGLMAVGGALLMTVRRRRLS